jgi:hypothetical protein
MYCPVEAFWENYESVWRFLSRVEVMLVDWWDATIVESWLALMWFCLCARRRGGTTTSHERARSALLPLNFSHSWVLYGKRRLSHQGSHSCECNSQVPFATCASIMRGHYGIYTVMLRLGKRKVIPTFSTNLWKSTSAERNDDVERGSRACWYPPCLLSFEKCIMAWTIQRFSSHVIVKYLYSIPFYLIYSIASSKSAQESSWQQRMKIHTCYKTEEFRWSSCLRCLREASLPWYAPFCNNWATCLPSCCR